MIPMICTMDNTQESFADIFHAPPLNETTQPQNTEQSTQKLVDVQITDENTAFNIMVCFLALAQKRGVFSFDESAKIFECIKIFQKA